MHGLRFSAELPLLTHTCADADTVLRGSKNCVSFSGRNRRQPDCLFWFRLRLPNAMERTRLSTSLPFDARERTREQGSDRMGSCCNDIPSTQDCQTHIVRPPFCTHHLRASERGQARCLRQLARPEMLPQSCCATSSTTGGNTAESAQHSSPLLAQHSFLARLAARRWDVDDYVDVD